MSTKVCPCGGSIVKRTSSLRGRDRRESNAVPAPTAIASAATAHASVAPRFPGGAAAKSGLRRPSLRNPLQLLATSPAVCQRPRDLREARLDHAISAGGVIGATLEIGAGSLDMMAVISEAWLEPRNAFLPVAIS